MQKIRAAFVKASIAVALTFVVFALSSCLPNNDTIDDSKSVSDFSGAETQDLYDSAVSADSDFDEYQVSDSVDNSDESVAEYEDDSNESVLDSEDDFGESVVDSSGTDVTLPVVPFDD